MLQHTSSSSSGEDPDLAIFGLFTAVVSCIILLCPRFGSEPLLHLASACVHVELQLLQRPLGTTLLSVAIRLQVDCLTLPCAPGFSCCMTELLHTVFGLSQPGSSRANTLCSTRSMPSQVYTVPAGVYACKYCRGHDDDICCLALAPDKRIAATGQLGKDPTVLVRALQLLLFSLQALSAVLHSEQSYICVVGKKTPELESALSMQPFPSFN
jgi:hypothetical protein